MKNKKRCILIADDEPRMLRALKDFFIANNFNVLTAVNGAEVLDLYYDTNSKIDIILLDVMMPIIDGMTVLENLRKNATLVPIIMLTAKSEEKNQLTAFGGGADDYITKPFSTSLLLARIEAVLRRFGKGSEPFISLDRLTIDVNNHKVWLDGDEIELTRREYDLLYYMVINKNVILSREQLLNSVWGYDFEGGQRTVDTHIRQLRAKLPGFADCIQTVHCRGYKLEV